MNEETSKREQSERGGEGGRERERERERDERISKSWNMNSYSSVVCVLLLLFLGVSAVSTSAQPTPDVDDSLSSDVFPECVGLPPLQKLQCFNQNFRLFLESLDKYIEQCFPDGSSEYVPSCPYCPPDRRCVAAGDKILRFLCTRHILSTLAIDELIQRRCHVSKSMLLTP